MTSAEIVIAFVKGRPELFAICKKKANDGFAPPEAVDSFIHEAFREGVTDDERKLLDQMRGNGAVDWQKVRDAFRESKDGDGEAVAR